MIKKTKKGYEVISHRTGKCLGIYKTKKEANSRLNKLRRWRLKNKLRRPKKLKGRSYY